MGAQVSSRLGLQAVLAPGGKGKPPPRSWEKQARNGRALRLTPSLISCGPETGVETSTISASCQKGFLKGR